jgi:hypothetical protein
MLRGIEMADEAKSQTGDTTTFFKGLSITDMRESKEQKKG